MVALLHGASSGPWLQWLQGYLSAELGGSEPGLQMPRSQLPGARLMKAWGFVFPQCCPPQGAPPASQVVTQ